MKILLKSFAYKNLGDDLFLYILCKAFPNIEFVTYSRIKYNICENLKIKKETKIIKIMNKLIRKISNGKYNYDSIIERKYDAYILIGGSMFIENIFEDKYKYITIPKIPYYVIGSNFGPYYDENYVKKYTSFFSNAQNVSFRDNYSKKLFNNNNIDVYPDLVFSLQNNNCKFTDKKVVISVIDVSSKMSKKYTELYKKIIISLIKKYDNEKYKICLISFCKEEGDERFIDLIINELNNQYDIKTYFYDGNIKKTLDVIKNCEIIIGSRYHANILGLLYQKKILPIVYSDKLTNVLHDINYNGPIIDLRNYSEKEIMNLNKLVLKKQKNINLDKIISESKKHLTKLESYLKEKK